MRYLSYLNPKPLRDKTGLVRIDLNTEDSWRLDASLPTLKFLAKNCRSLVILSHKGRPIGFDKNFSLKRYALVISKLLKKPVIFIPNFNFKKIEGLVKSSPRGSIFLLENLRFLKGESENNPALAKNLAALGDLYINEAFAVSHRANASVAAITKFLPSYAGFGLESEIANLSRVMRNPKKPLVVILGGLKIADKLGVVKNLQAKTAAFLIGGALDKKMLGKLSKIKKIILPVDFKYDQEIIRDIGPKSVKLFQSYIRNAKTILWNGPIGNINKPRFQNATRVVAKSIVANKNAFKVIGGGETIMYLKKLKLDKKIDFVSTGGGAMLDFLAGKKLPGIKVLE